MCKTDQLQRLNELIEIYHDKKNAARSYSAKWTTRKYEIDDLWIINCNKSRTFPV